MRIGIPTEVKDNEYRVALTPAGAHALTAAGHDVLVQKGAGDGSGLPDEAYVAAGARTVPTADDAWSAELVCKIKEPVESEYGQLRSDQVLFTYLHLAASRSCTEALVAAGTTAVAYETVQLPDGSLPLLAPMSEVAGRLATQEGAHHLLRSGGGRGVLLGGVPGAAPGRVVVLGVGTAGWHAMQVAVGMQAEVTVLDVSLPRLREVSARYGGRVRTLASTAHAVAEAVADADLVIGAVLVPGGRTPVLVTDPMIAGMRPGAVLVDVAVDQGGCVEGSHPTTYSDPVFGVHEALMYCVANMPGAVPVTSTRAITAATLPYLVALAGAGWRAALAADPALARGLNTHAGAVLHAGVAEAHGMRPGDLASVIA